MESISPKKELFQALQKVQAEMPSLKKSKEGFNYKYTPLEEMLSVIQPVLHKNGLMLKLVSLVVVQKAKNEAIQPVGQVNVSQVRHLRQ